MKEALLVRIGGLGDLLIALPSIRLVRGKYPRARLTLACRREYGGLLRERGVVDEIMPEDSRLLLPFFSAEAESKPEFSDWLRSFDLIIAWSHGLKGTLPDLSPTADGFPSRVRVIRADPRESGQLSRAFYSRTAEVIGESAAPSIDDLARLPAAGDHRSAKSMLKKGGVGRERPVVVHPGSGSASKRWPIQNFLRITARLGEHGVPGVLVTGEAEETLAAEVERFALPSTWAWIRCPYVSDLAMLLSESSLYLGNDSGVTHLAAACGADVVALFRRDLITAWAPLGKVELQAAGSLSEMGVEAVWTAVASRLPNLSADRRNR
jgi:ADP-heptose:LPS heptosyltransferase